jgi:hypothetical protein
MQLQIYYKQNGIVDISIKRGQVLLVSRTLFIRLLAAVSQLTWWVMARSCGGWRE